MKLYVPLLVLSYVLENPVIAATNLRGPSSSASVQQGSRKLSPFKKIKGRLFPSRLTNDQKKYVKEMVASWEIKRDSTTDIDDLKDLQNERKAQVNDYFGLSPQASLASLEKVLAKKLKDALKKDLEMEKGLMDTSEEMSLWFETIPPLAVINRAVAVWNQEREDTKTLAHFLALQNKRKMVVNVYFKDIHPDASFEKGFGEALMKMFKIDRQMLKKFGISDKHKKALYFWYDHEMEDAADRMEKFDVHGDYKNIIDWYDRNSINLPVDPSTLTVHIPAQSSDVSSISA